MGQGENERVETAMLRGRASHGKMRLPCPFCEDEGHRDKKTSLVVFLDTGRWMCFRCANKGRLSAPPDPDYIMGMRATREVINFVKDIKAFDPPPGFLLLAEEPARTAEMFEPARDYLLSKRKIPWNIIEAAGIGVVCSTHTTRWDNRIIVPIKDWMDDAWLGWVGRLWVNSDKLKYLYPPDMTRAEILYNERVLHPNDKERLLMDEGVMPKYRLVVEGVFDVLPFHDLAVAALGKISASQMEKLRQCPWPIVFVPDGDEWEGGWANAMGLRPLKDAGSIRLPPRVDPDEVPREVILKAAALSLCISKSVQLKDVGYVTTRRVRR